MNYIQEASAKRKTLLRARADLSEELDRSLALQSLWPEVFDNGQATAKMSGSCQTPAAFCIILKDGLGQEKSFPFWTIPLVLIDFHLARLIAQILRDPKRYPSGTIDAIERMRRKLDKSGRL